MGSVSERQPVGVSQRMFERSVVVREYATTKMDEESNLMMALLVV